MSLTFTKQKRPAYQADFDVRPPNCKWFSLIGFKLSQIPEKFEGLDFQRQVANAHIRRIVISILNNQFFDNVIRIVKSPNGKYKVIDGQHRLQALWQLHRDFGLEKYDIILQYFKSEEAVLVYRKINAGKALTMKDFLKTMDDGKTPFFNELRDVCSHYEQKVQLNYNSALQALAFARDGDTHGVRKDELNEFMKTITIEEIEAVYRLAAAVQQVFNEKLNPKVFNATLVRPIHFHGKRLRFSIRDYIKGINKMFDSKEFKEIRKSRLNAVEAKKILELTRDVLK